MTVSKKDFLGGNTRDRETFLKDLVLELAHTIQSVVGHDEAEGFVKIVGLRIGDAMYSDYTDGRKEDAWSLEFLAEVLIDLKRKINGGFRVESCRSDEIVLVNDRCPFGPAVKGLPALCQMTSSVFGRISAQSQGKANVFIEEAIARGDSRCRVVIRFSGSPKDGVDFFEVR